MARLWDAVKLALRREPSPRSGRLMFSLGFVFLLLTLAGAVRAGSGPSPSLPERLSDLALPLMLLAVGGADLLRPDRRTLAATLRAVGLLLALFTLFAVLL